MIDQVANIGSAAVIGIYLGYRAIYAVKHRNDNRHEGCPDAACHQQVTDALEDIRSMKSDLKKTREDTAWIKGKLNGTA